MNRNRQYLLTVSIIFILLSFLFTGSQGAEFLTDVFVDDLFSPQGMNSAASIMFTLNQTAWVSIRIEDTNKNIVRLLVNKIMNPQQCYFLWDGTDQHGQLVPEGLYYCIIRAQDPELGNIYQEVSNPIILEHLGTITIKGVDNSVFSPNGDGVKDTVNITYETLHPGYVSAEIQDLAVVKDKYWEIIRTYPRNFKQPGTYIFSWDGKSDKGDVKEGCYEVIMKLYRTLESKLAMDCPVFCIVDITPPKITVFSPIISLKKFPCRIEYLITDEMQKKIFLMEEAENFEINVTIKIFNETGKIIRTLVNNLPRKLAIEELGNLEEQKNSDIWDGKDDFGTNMKGGIYKCVIEATDLAGNRGFAEQIIKLSTTLPRLNYQ